MPRVSINGTIDSNTKAKDDAEERWAEFFGGTFEDQYDALISELDKEKPEDPGDDWWQDWLATMLGFSTIELQHIAGESALASIETLGIGVELDSVFAPAENWASTYGFNLVRDINATSRQALQTALQRYYTSDINYDTLVQQLATRYSPVRASMIATTEVTRGFERGMDIYQDALTQQGMNSDRAWFTMQDEIVCPFCAPNEGRLRTQGWTIGTGPPAHPSCRCWTQLVILAANRSRILVPNWPRKASIIASHAVLTNYPGMAILKGE